MRRGLQQGPAHAGRLPERHRVGEAPRRAGPGRPGRPPGLLQVRRRHRDQAQPHRDERATGLPVDDARAVCTRPPTLLLDKLDLEAVVITLDKNGSYLATRDGERRWLKTRPRQVYDVTGAGDMVLAMLAVARAAGATWVEAVALANVAGGLEVEKFGSVPITPDEIIQELLSEAHEHLGKERTLEQLLPELQRHRAAGKRIVFTNGCFDLIHLGHVEVLPVRQGSRATCWSSA